MPLRTCALPKLAVFACVSALAIGSSVPATAQYGQRYAPPAPAAQGVPREHLSTVESSGGLYPGPVQAYVSDVGGRVAAAAGRPGQCGFHVLNTDVVNAFTSPPGCHVYVTRGLLALINSEDELASVLAHEVGHVTANHAGRRQQRSVLTGLGALILGAVTRSGDVASLASQLGKANMLSYSRNQEFEADDLAVRTLAPAGYSPYGLAEVLNALQREDRFDNARRGRQGQETAAWARSHPLTGDRVQRAVQAARQLSAPPVAGELPGHQGYLRTIDGLLYGDDPEQGFVEGRRFLHPSLRIGFQAPPNFALTNAQQAVAIEGPSGFVGQFAAGRLTSGLEEYSFQVVRQAAGQTPLQVDVPEHVRIGGLDAVVLRARAQSSSRGDTDITVAAYSEGSGQAFHFLLLSPAGRADAWDPLIGSFHRLDPREAASARPKHVEVVRVRQGDSVNSLSHRMAFDDYRLERFLMLNGLQQGEPLRPGAEVKLVTYGGR